MRLDQFISVLTQKVSRSESTIVTLGSPIFHLDYLRCKIDASCNRVEDPASVAVPFHHHLARRDDVSECAMDDDEFFPFNNGQKRIGGDGAKIMPNEKERKKWLFFVAFRRYFPNFLRPSF